MRHRAVSLVAARGGGVMTQELLQQMEEVAVVPGLRGG